MQNVQHHNIQRVAHLQNVVQSGPQMVRQDPNFGRIDTGYQFVATGPQSYQIPNRTVQGNTRVSS